MRRLLIFLKYPTPGEVKTRLAAALGDRPAARVYRACAELTLARLRSFRNETALCVDPPGAVDRTRQWLGSGWALRPQRGATLGERLTEATDAAFAQGAQRVVVIGTDSPWMRGIDVEETFAALERVELAIGRTQDGGYYLIGLSRPAPALFERIVWSTPSVYMDTLANAHALGLRVQTLREGYDVDYLEDVQRFLAEESARGNPSTLVKAIVASSVRT